MFDSKRTKNKRFAFIAATAVLLGALWGCQAAQTEPSAKQPAILLPTPAAQRTAAQAPASAHASDTAQETTSPKEALRYVFLFIGDGMGPNQVQCVNEALLAQGASPLCFLDFPVMGEASTNNASGDLTDSAAAATAIATGKKTNNGMLGKLPDGMRSASFAERMHAAGYGVGILTTVSMDNATPAGFYAHTDSRTNYSDIGTDLFISGFDYFAGGGFHDGPSVAELAKQFRYTLAYGDAEADAAKPDERLVLIASTLTGDRGMTLAADHDSVRDGQLARNVRRGMERLARKEKGFFLMTEGGRIDLACHYHDAGDLYWEMADFDLAVREALKFYEAHPDETLIIVTADHETGGLQLADGTREALAKQTISCDRFDETTVARFKEQKTDFETALPEICTAFGLDDLTEEERAYLKKAYRDTIRGKLSKAVIQKRYGVYSPIASAAGNLVAARAGLTFTSFGHSAVRVPVYAIGVGADTFAGTYENTAICDKLMELMAFYGA